MNLEHLSNSKFGLLFDVQRSIRYHNRRCGFFEFMHRVTSVLTILMAGSVLFDIGKTGVNGGEVSTASWLIAISIFAAILAAMDMVIGYAKYADLHRNLKNRFIRLEQKILLSADLSDDSDLQNLIVKRLEIERAEPPIYRALDTLCYNELLAVYNGILVSMGKDECKYEYKPIRTREKLTCHVYTWPDIASS